MCKAVGQPLKKAVSGQVKWDHSKRQCLCHTTTLLTVACEVKQNIFNNHLCAHLWRSYSSSNENKLIIIPQANTMS